MLINNYRRPALLLSFASLLCLGSAVPTFAQDWHRDSGGPPPMERSFHAGGHGRWWDNPRMAQQIGITDDQKKKMDDIFQQHRLQLIDLNAGLQKQEAILQPLIESDQPEESRILGQIDSIAQARAELEKANARMLFGIRKVLTPDQWKKLQTMVHDHMGGDDRPGGPGGERAWRHPRGGNGAPNGQGAPGGQGTPGGQGAPAGQQPPPPGGSGQPNE